MYIVFISFENIAKLFKSTEENKIMIELLFENLKEKPNKFEKHLNLIKCFREVDDYSKSNSPIIQLIKDDSSNKNIINNASPIVSQKKKK